jgi:hypothetical protein
MLLPVLVGSRARPYSSTLDVRESRPPVELGGDEGGLAPLGDGQRPEQLGPVGTLAGLDLAVGAEDVGGVAAGMGGDGDLLALEAEAEADVALSLGADAVVGDELRAIRRPFRPAYRRGHRPYKVEYSGRFHPLVGLAERSDLVGAAHEQPANRLAPESLEGTLPISMEPPHFALPRPEIWKSTPSLESPCVSVNTRLLPSGACRASSQNGATWMKCSPGRMNFNS